MKACNFIRLDLILLMTVALSPLARTQTPITGDWQGLLDAGGPKLHLVLHITAAKDGALSATLDSVDQPGANGIPVSAISVKDGKFSLTVDAVHGAYEGTLSKDFGTIDGIWTQGAPLPLSFTHIPIDNGAPKVGQSTLLGTWLGSLDTGAIKLRIVFKIEAKPDGLTAQMQSPDQGPTWIPATSLTQSGAALTITLKNLAIAYEGKIAADGNSIEGTFTQAGNPMQLSLKRIKGQSELELPRPQNPVKPYPYREEDVTFPNKAGGNTLAGTFTIPSGNGPFPAVELIVGSGPHDRDESLLGHKPFLVLSDDLTRKGIAVLRVDKRGIGKSTGDYLTATTADFATDTEAGVAWLKTRPEVDPHKIGLIGHSEGAIIAPMVAAADPDVAFIVMMAGSGVPGDQIIVEQGRLIAIAAGQSKDDAGKNAEKTREALSVVETEKDPATLDRLLTVKLSAEGVPDSAIAGQIKSLTTPWIRVFLTYDPATALRKLKIPVLALNGSLDLQVPPAQNLPPIRKAFQDAGNTRAEVDELPGLNHLFQTAKTGAPSEYGQIEETISPAALDKIASWILKQ